MPGLLFTNVWMLAGMAALSVPVIIHLLLRRKKKRVRFSTIQFFMKQDEQSTQRRRLRNFLLLAMRLLICALLVLAFARPYLDRTGAAGGGDTKRQALIVLDRSLSMQANAADGPKWIRAREAARQILSTLKPDDRAALVSCAGQAEVLSEWAPAVAVSKALSDLQPTYTAALLGDGLRQATRLLSFGDPKAATTIYIISDLQRSSSQNLMSVPVPVETEVKVVKVGDLAAPNLTVSDLQIAGPDVKPHALVTSFSDEDTPEVKLEFRVDGQAVSTQSLALGAGASTNIELALPNLKPGWHDTVLQLRGHDALALDDARYQTLFVPEPIRVLMADSRRTSRSFEREGFFITTALDPSGDSTNGPASGFVCETVAPEEIASKLALRPGPLPCDVVVLPALKQVPLALATALTSYVQAGGGLLMFVGEGVSANRYNSEFRELLPVQLGDLETSPDPEFGWRIGEYNTNLTVFAAFQGPTSGNLSLARFMKRFSFAAPNPEALAARFVDGTPFVMTRMVGRGHVVLVNTSADTSWNDWPKHKTFVPWLHGTGLFLAGSTPRDQIQSQASLLAGADTDIDLGPGATKASFKSVLPDNKEVNWATDAQGQIRDVVFSKPGIYRVRDERGADVRRIAVNVPTQESDLSALSANDFQQQIARVRQPANTTLAAGLFGSAGHHKELWRVLLLAVLVLLFLELLVANRTLA
jgi:hypothetical protein